MENLLSLDGHGVRVLLTAHPVTRGEFKAYLVATGRPIPGPLSRPEPPATPVTYVAQIDAQAYCAWLAGREGRPYRLPRLAELQELFSEDSADGFSPELWPHTHGQRPEVLGGLKPVFLCEWTEETDEIPGPGGSIRSLGSIFYPPWLRQGSNSVHAEARLLASEGYSFVTFRVACERL